MEIPGGSVTTHSTEKEATEYAQELASRNPEMDYHVHAFPHSVVIARVRGTVTTETEIL